MDRSCDRQDKNIMPPLQHRHKNSQTGAAQLHIYGDLDKILLHDIVKSTAFGDDQLKDLDTGEVTFLHFDRFVGMQRNKKRDIRFKNFNYSLILL